jgi:hypothetical protein
MDTKFSVASPHRHGLVSGLADASFQSGPLATPDDSAPDPVIVALPTAALERNLSFADFGVDPQTRRIVPRTAAQLTPAEGRLQATFWVVAGTRVFSGQVPALKGRPIAFSRCLSGIMSIREAFLLAGY